jgi:hypothetical protein
VVVWTFTDIFFYMSERHEHLVTPRRSYHVNVLSRDRIGERFIANGLTPEFVHIKSLLAKQFGFDGYYNRRAWTVVARRG